MNLILASASPRRKELLEQLQWEFVVQVSEKEELITSTKPDLVVEELSKMKAEDVFQQIEGDIIVIGADTIVAMENHILGKPKDKQQACEMLQMLQDASHDVYTGVTICMREGNQSKKITFHEKTTVTFYSMTDQEIRWYVDTKEPMDKAGAYGIQGLGGSYVKEINGDYNTVVGLPMARVYQEMKRIRNNEESSNI